MAGQPWEVLSGGAGVSAPAPPNANAAVLSGTGQQPHHGVVGLVLVAVLVIFLLDKAGFRFAVTAGRR
jgi:hypothetical protein